MSYDSELSAMKSRRHENENLRKGVRLTIRTLLNVRFDIIKNHPNEINYDVPDNKDELTALMEILFSSSLEEIKKQTNLLDNFRF
jgi:hypothetical protein